MTVPINWYTKISKKKKLKNYLFEVPFWPNFLQENVFTYVTIRSSILVDKLFTEKIKHCKTPLRILNQLQFLLILFQLDIFI